MHPRGSVKFIKTRKVTLESLLNSDISTVLTANTDQWLAQLERESINQKLNAVVGVCDESVIDHLLETYDMRRRINIIDAARHQWVHGTIGHEMTYAELQEHIVQCGNGGYMLIILFEKWNTFLPLSVTDDEE